MPGMSAAASADPKRSMLRHPVATLAGRCGKAIADAPRHTGQIGMLRRIGMLRQIGMLRRSAGSRIRGETYFRAEIVAGRVGPERSKRFEFD